MHKITILLVFLCAAVFSGNGQVNPVQNLTWYHDYFNMTNYFNLMWEEPAAPHDELLGYNVYRGSDLYLFTTENSVHHLPEGSNSNDDFLFYADGMEFESHVTAVYASGEESLYTQTVLVEGAWLNINEASTNILVYPNPTSGMLTITNPDSDKFTITDISGKTMRTFSAGQSEIDITDLPDGIYFLRLYSNNTPVIKKIILQK